MLSIVIPCYKEASRGDLKDRLEQVVRVMSSSDVEYEVIAVNDGSPDNTLEVLQDIEGIKVVNIAVNGGKGNALKVGFKESSGDLLLFMDADLSVRPEKAVDFYHKIHDGECLIASRYCSGAVISPRQSIFRQVLSKMSRLLIRTLIAVPVHDTQCGFKMFYAKDYFKVADYIEDERWLFDLELLMYLRKSGIKVREEGVHWGNYLETTMVGFSAALSSLKGICCIMWRRWKHRKTFKVLHV